MYSKNDVELHAEWFGPSRPAVNVKVYHFPCTYQVEEDLFNCSEEVAEKALKFAFESAQQRFWEDAQKFCDEYLGEGKVYSEGHSGGWLVVDRLSDFDSWDAIMLSKWYRFEKAIKAEIDYLCSWENVREDIEANRWAEEGARLYNFYEYKDGHSECLVDMAKEGKTCIYCGKVLGEK